MNQETNAPNRWPAGAEVRESTTSLARGSKWLPVSRQLYLAKNNILSDE